MYTKHQVNPYRPYFYGVAMALIVTGAGFVAVSLVQAVFNLFAGSDYANVGLKAIGGLVVLALGYIQIELELLRLAGGRGGRD